MDGPQADDQIPSPNRNDISPGRTLGEQRERNLIRIRVEGGNQGHPIGEVEIRVAGRATPAVRERHDPRRW